MASGSSSSTAVPVPASDGGEATSVRQMTPEEHWWWGTPERLMTNFHGQWRSWKPLESTDENRSMKSVRKMWATSPDRTSIAHVDFQEEVPPQMPTAGTHWDLVTFESTQKLPPQMPTAGTHWDLNDWYDFQGEMPAYMPKAGVQWDMSLAQHSLDTSPYSPSPALPSSPPLPLPPSPPLPFSPSPLLPLSPSPPPPLSPSPPLPLSPSPPLPLSPSPPLPFSPSPPLPLSLSPPLPLSPSPPLSLSPSPPLPLSPSPPLPLSPSPSPLLSPSPPLPLSPRTIRTTATMSRLGCSIQYEADGAFRTSVAVEDSLDTNERRPADWVSPTWGPGGLASRLPDHLPPVPALDDKTVVGTRTVLTRNLMVEEREHLSWAEEWSPNSAAAAAAAAAPAAASAAAAGFMGRVPQGDEEKYEVFSLPQGVVACGPRSLQLVAGRPFVLSATWVVGAGLVGEGEVKRITAYWGADGGFERVEGEWYRRQA
ncbi:unnamed protein product [Closterium sp. Naga37s-1]|nr:unnamed protein product [Closterium sp. Naga37s-1]